MNKEKILEIASRFDVCSGGESVADDVYVSSKKCVLYKTLYSNECSFDCSYCMNSFGSNKVSATLEPEKIAKKFYKLYLSGVVNGLFLSSAVNKDPDSTMQKMVETAKIVRLNYGFSGYIHLKVLPGASYDVIKQASFYATRMSVNIEVPSKSWLSELSSIKDFGVDLVRRQVWLKRLCPNQTTQFIVGATDETDLEILRMADWEYKNLMVRRVYYSNFKPIVGTKLESRIMAPLSRTTRLYNADFLMRSYSYKFKEFKEISHDGMLPNGDPKVEIAKLTFDKPIEVNDANYHELIRVPGIGLKTASKIIRFRKQRRIKKNCELKKLGVILKRALPFIKVDGRYQKRLRHNDKEIFHFSGEY